MLRTHHGLHLLGPADLPEMEELTARDPVVNVFADYRARLTRLDPRWLGGEVWGYRVDGRLVAACHAAANLVPVNAGADAVAAFAERAASQPRRCATLVGPAEQVDPMWELLTGVWGPGREVRRRQPHLEMRTPSPLVADPLVRRTTAEDLEALYPACVAMYTEEVGVSPEVDGGRDLYRARVQQLVRRGWSFSRIEDGRVLFKAEVACATPYACQIQGVYVDPELRGQGLASAGMTTVVQICLREIAPAVSLYVNAHNLAARAAYEHAGFRQDGTFATIMF